MSPDASLKGPGPADRHEEQRSEAVPAEESADAPTGVAVVQDKTCNILLVEDNPHDAFLLIRALTRASDAHFEVTHVERLEDALKHLREGRFDLVLLDLSLPDSTPEITLDVLQQRAPRVPVVAVSGYDDKAVALRAVQAGAQDYLVKGHIDERALDRFIHFAIERRLAEAEVDRLEERLNGRGSPKALTQALPTILKRICHLTGWVYGEAWVPSPDGQTIERDPAWYAADGGFEEFEKLSERLKFPPGEGFPGRVWQSRRPVTVTHIASDPDFRSSWLAEDLNLRDAALFPVLSRGQVAAVLAFFIQGPKEEESSPESLASNAQ